MDAPHLILVGPPMAPPVELNRWLRDSRSQGYDFRPRAAGLHAFASVRHKVPIELPLLLSMEGPTGGLLPSILSLDEQLPRRETLFPDKGDRAFVERLCRTLFSPAVQTFYFHMLPHRKVLGPSAGAGAPRLDRLFVRLAYPLWRRMMAGGLKLNTFDAATAARAIDSSFAEVEKELGARTFLGGDEPGIRDIVFAVLASPVILPPGHPAPIPAIDRLPDSFRRQVEALRSRQGGQLALRIYERRPVPMDWGRSRPDRPKLSQRLITPKLVRALARLAARRAPRVFKVGKQVFVSRFDDVQEVLRRDGEFLIGPVNRERIEGVMGPFILGMDNSAELRAQRTTTYRALDGTDHAGAALIVQKEAERLASAAAGRFARIDVVSSYARPIAARAAVHLFGVAGPSEADLIRAARAVFHETFLNLSGDKKVRKRGKEAGKEIQRWIEHEVRRRGSKPAGKGDLIDELLEQVATGQLPPIQLPWITAGLLVGAIDTTATAVANIVCEFVTDKQLAKSMRLDVDNPHRFLGWCWEALRRRPHNPLLLREAAGRVSFAGQPIAARSRVWALTLAAMQDARAFSEPATLRPDRPLDRYLHFGAGLHRCSGRELNARHIPMLVAELIRHGLEGPHHLRFRGPFPDRLIVRLERPH